MHIAAIEPFYGGSHRAILDGWVKFSRHRFSLLTLPGTAWKWRLAGGAVPLAAQLKELFKNDPPDLLWCSSMTHLVQLKGFCPDLQTVPVVYYWHEYEGTYTEQSRSQKDADLHYPLIQIASSLLADRWWFNSQYLMNQYCTHADQLLDGFPSPRISGQRMSDLCASRGSVLYPAVDDDLVDLQISPAGKIRIAWNHRWSPEKGMEELRRVIEYFNGHHPDVQFVLLGIGRDVWMKNNPQEAKFFAECDQPDCSHRIDYLNQLARCSHVLSTASHENYGLSVQEGLALGLHPLVPDRLVYPELYLDRWTNMDELVSLVFNQSSMQRHQVHFWSNTVDKWDSAAEQCCQKM